MKLFIFHFGKVKPGNLCKKTEKKLFEMSMTAILNQSVLQFDRSQGTLWFV